jgi:hypothetical protein
MMQAATRTGLVSTRTNNGLYFRLNPPTATLSNPKATTALSVSTSPALLPYPCTASSSTVYDHPKAFSATLTRSGSGTPVSSQLITFTLGSQRKTAPTIGGATSATATVCMNVQAIPDTYALVADFAETATLLGSAASVSVPVQKKATQLNFAKRADGITPNPFIAILKDADGNLLREQTVFFTVSGGPPPGLSTPITLSAQTGPDGQAQLRGMVLAAGTYDVTVSFPGQIPVEPGVPQSSCGGGANCSIVLNDERYSPSTATLRAGLTADLTPPSCILTAVIAGPPTQLQITVQDTESGIASVNANELVNAFVTIPRYAAGVQTPLLITATKVDESLGSRVALQVFDVAGNVTNCDPYLVTLGVGPGVSRTETLTRVPQAESKITVYNQTPGVSGLSVKVNDKDFHLSGLKDGQTRFLDVARAMRPGAKNTIVLTAQGKRGGRVVVMIADTATVKQQREAAQEGARKRSEAEHRASRRE